VQVGGGGSEGGHDGVVVEEGRERVGAAQGTGKVQWGVAFPNESSLLEQG
jgi:hypothetical protein